MTNEQKLAEIQTIKIVWVSTASYHNACKAQAEEIARLDHVKTELEKALSAAEWLDKKGYKLGTSAFNEKVTVSNGLAFIVRGLNEEYIKKIPVTVTDSESVLDTQKQAWNAMSDNEKVLFTLRCRIEAQEAESEMACLHHAWLQEECEE